MSDSLPEDKLNRKDEVSFLQNYLTNRYELKKDEPFFLKSMKQKLEKEHKVIYFNAWRNDFTKESLVAFIATMTEELSECFDAKDKKAKAFFKVVFKSSLPLIVAILSKQLAGCTLDELDELDRCRPNYAIKLLENIKHLFDIPGIVFIVATNSKQLSYSINAVYGEKFASEKYLKRFFDQKYTLKEPDKYKYCKYFDELANNKIINENIKLYKYMDSFGMDEENFKIRDLIVLYRKLSLFTIRTEVINLSNRNNNNAVIDNIIHQFFNNKDYELLKNYSNLVLNAEQLE